MNKNSQYWEKRIAEPTWNIYNSLEEKNRDLLEMYQEASSSISDELYKLAEKMKTATPMLSDMHKFNRLTNLQNNINIIIKELGSNVENFGKKNMYKGFSNNYKATMEAIGELDFAIPNKKLMEQLLNKPWLGNNFSERLWKNTKVLAMNLNDILTTGLIQGKTVTEMSIQLNNRMNKGFNVAHRLVRTETMHALNESSFQAYKDAGCKKVQYWAAEDERTCPRCGIKHGNIYNIIDRPALPLHANCRCTYLPVIDEDSYIQSGGRFDKGSVEWWAGRADESDEYYRSIRVSKDDIDKIAKNTNWTKESIIQIKNHVFYNEHILANGNKGVLDSDYDMAVAWQRLINDDFKERDILLLKHEYLESILEKKYNLSNSEAHKRTTKLHDWVTVMENETGGGEDDTLNELIKQK